MYLKKLVQNLDRNTFTVVATVPIGMSAEYIS
jgi:hypothetical protein